MSEDLYLCEATLENIPAIREIAALAFYETYAGIVSGEQIEYMLTQMYSNHALKEQVEGLGHKFILLKSGQIILGFASVSQKGERLRLHKLYLHPHQKGLGFGRKLIEAVVKEAEQLGLRKIELNVNRENSAVNFYKKVGFQVEREEDVPIGDYFMNDYVMVKVVD